VRDDRSSYVDAAAWAALVAGAVPWCGRCRTSCPGHSMRPDVVEHPKFVLMMDEDDPVSS
jgi:hypothetical protein